MFILTSFRLTFELTLGTSHFYLVLFKTNTYLNVTTMITSTQIIYPDDIYIKCINYIYTFYIYKYITYYIYLCNVYQFDKM